MSGARTWVVGASSGIGAALASELADRGDRLAISGRRRDRLEQLAGARMQVQPCDATDRAAVQSAAAAVTDVLGGIDVAVYSAGTWRQMDVDHWDPAVIREHFEVHVLGLANLIEAVLPGMLARGSGTIVGVSSVAGYRGLPRAEAYSSAKAGQQLLLESLRADLAPRGLRVVTVCPGFVRTEMTEGNVFPMPWLMEADDAARRIADGLAHGKPEIVFPVPMMVAMKLARLVPVRAWGRLSARATRGRGPVTPFPGAAAAPRPPRP